MAVFDRIHRMPFWARFSITFGILILLMLVVRTAPWVKRAGRDLFVSMGLPESEAVWLSFFTFVAWPGSLGELLVLRLVVRIEQPADWKRLFLVHRPDWRGFWTLLAVFGILIWLETLFLNRLLWDPIESRLMSLGLWTEPALPAPPRAYLALNVIVLALLSWAEMPEELYFRGYLQRELTVRLGAVWGIVLNVLIWDLWHIWNPAMFVRRFFITLPHAIVVHFRGRVWASMLVHPLTNRIGAVYGLLSG